MREVVFLLPIVSLILLFKIDYTFDRRLEPHQVNNVESDGNEENFHRRVV